MSQRTIGDVFGAAYQTGRGIGNDFSQMRFGRRAEKIRQQYEELAKQHNGVLPPAAVAQMEADLEDAYSQTGGRKRAVTGRDGQSLAQGALGDMRERAKRLGYAAAGEAAIAGNNADAYEFAGNTELAQGNFGGGMEGRMSAQVIRDTTAGIGGGLQVGTDAQGAPMRGIDEVGVQHRLSNTAAQYGKPEHAIALSRGAEASRLDAAAAIAGRMQILATQPHTQERYDGMKALWEGIKQWVPEFAHIDVEPQEDQVYLYGGGKPVGSLTYEELTPMLETAMADPRKVVSGVMEARRGEAAYQREKGDKVEGEVRAGLIDIIKELTKQGATATAEAIKLEAEARSQGWKNIVTDQDTGTTFVQAPDGNLYQLHPTAGEVEGQPIPGFRVTTRTGQEVDPAKLAELGDVSVVANLMSARAAVQAAGEEATWQRALQRLSGIRGGGVSAPSRRAPAGGGDRYMQLRDAVEKAESNNNPDAVSPKGAIGRMQTMPGTLRDPGYGVAPARDNSDAELTRVGNEYLQAMLAEFSDERAALAAYNWGPGNVEKALAEAGGDVDKMLASAPAETRNYVAKVLGAAGQAPATRTAQAAPAAPKGIPTEKPAVAAKAPSAPAAQKVDLAALEAARAELAAWDAEVAKLPAGGSRARFGAAAASREGIPLGSARDAGVEKRVVQAREKAARRVAQLETAAARQAAATKRTADLSAGSQAFDEIAARVLQGSSAGAP